jgi:hypothetical protein
MLNRIIHNLNYNAIMGKIIKVGALVYLPFGKENGILTTYTENMYLAWSGITPINRLVTEEYIMNEYEKNRIEIIEISQSKQ